MKNSLTFFLVLASWTIYAQSDNPKLIGQWEGFQGADSMTFVFEKDSIVTMLNKTKKETIGGRENVREGRKVRTIYSVDLSERPFAIDLIIQETETNHEQGRMKGIFVFLGENKMKINFGPGNSRPTTFDQFSVTMTKE